VVLAGLARSCAKSTASLLAGEASSRISSRRVRVAQRLKIRTNYKDRTNTFFLPSRGILDDDFRFQYRHIFLRDWIDCGIVAISEFPNEFLFTR
jgi:hypothetical protein